MSFQKIFNIKYYIKQNLDIYLYPNCIQTAKSTLNVTKLSNSKPVICNGMLTEDRTSSCKNILNIVL